MRPPRLVLAVLLAALTLTGCGLFQDDKDREIERLLDEKALFTVFLANDVTPQQKADIEERLRAVAGSTAVTFVDHETAYTRMKELHADEPQTMPDVAPADLPQSFDVTMTDQDAVRAVRDSALLGELKALPGVVDVVVTCTTVEECRKGSGG